MYQRNEVYDMFCWSAEIGKNRKNYPKFNPYKLFKISLTRFQIFEINERK